MSTLAASITSYFLGEAENAALTDLKERTIRIETLLSKILEERSIDGRDVEREDRPAPRAIAALGVREK